MHISKLLANRQEEEEEAAAAAAAAAAWSRQLTSLRFLKSEADLEYIERRLKLDFINGASARGSFAKENVTGILENLKSIKAKHSLLRCQVSQITDAQKGSMELIRNRLSTAMELIKHCQQASHLEVESLAESEQESAMFLDSTITSITAEDSPAQTTSF
ncbi:SKA complex subunit 2 isoform X1 [Poecilia latipinna]|uniref:SKA complex subunit 2 isoform X1 n=1 Tax=Poecilia latipinna TaxID=48699 RepID=UPI00072EC2F8|nr:PREDICTED: spindle and kinetochore-associated protein 2 isoform X1 [Poecilia latipinna]